MSLSDRSRIEVLLDCTDEYLAHDLDARGIWNTSAKARYGGVIFNARGEVLLREPSNHFDGYVWTFPKGAPEHNESPAQTALREVREETGLVPRIVGHLVPGFSGTSTGWMAYFYLMVDLVGIVDEEAVAVNGETATLRWAARAEAESLISKTTNIGGRSRDRAVLKESFLRLDDLLAGLSEQK
jgi:8-oxo-dGTP pyrophosphatase MutT (NUDIX family)